jgi:hypothetical protein
MGDKKYFCNFPIGFVSEIKDHLNTLDNLMGIKTKIRNKFNESIKFLDSYSVDRTDKVNQDGGVIFIHSLEDEIDSRDGISKFITDGYPFEDRIEYEDGWIYTMYLTNNEFTVEIFSKEKTYLLKDYRR